MPAFSVTVDTTLGFKQVKLAEVMDFELQLVGSASKDLAGDVSAPYGMIESRFGVSLENGFEPDLEQGFGVRENSYGRGNRYEMDLENGIEPDLEQGFGIRENGFGMDLENGFGPDRENPFQLGHERHKSLQNSKNSSWAPAVALPVPSGSNKLTCGLAAITHLCFEGFQHLEQIPPVLIKLRNILMETIYYCIEVNRQVYEEFMYSISQKSKLYMKKLIHKALRMCRSDACSTTCYHVIKCAHDITLLTFTFTNPYKFPSLLEANPKTSTESVSEEEDGHFEVVPFLETNRLLINSMTKLKQQFGDPKSNECVNNTPRDLFRFEFKQILSLLKRINSILLNNCTPDETIFFYYLKLINEKAYAIHDLESFEEYLCHFSRLQTYTEQMEANPAEDPYFLQSDISSRKRKAILKQKQRRENAYNRMHSLGPLFRDTRRLEDRRNNSRFQLYHQLRQKGIEIHPNGSHNINVTSEFLQQVEMNKSQAKMDQSEREAEQSEADELIEAETDPRTKFIQRQRKLIRAPFQELICNFPRLKWCTPLQSINYLQIFVDLFNEIYHEELVIEQNYDDSGNIEDTVIRRMNDVFDVKRGHYNFREQASKGVKIPDFVNYFSRVEDNESLNRLDPSKSELGSDEYVMSTQNWGDRLGENHNFGNAGARISNELSKQLKSNLSKHDAAGSWYKQYQRECESKYNAAYEVLCESEHVHRTEKWKVYFAQLKAGFDSESMHITNCKIDDTSEKKPISGSETGDAVDGEERLSFTSPISHVPTVDGEDIRDERIPLSLKVFQLNEAVAYEVRNIRANYEDAHVVKKVDFKLAKCYKCKYIPWHKH